MDKVINIEEALKRIEELEKENAKLREELEYYRNRNLWRDFLNFPYFSRLTAS